jgi:hypothetical protein
MSGTNEQPRPRGPNGGRRRKRRPGESWAWIDQEEQRHSQPVSGRYQRFIELEQGQQRQSLGDAKLFPEDAADEASFQFDREARPMAANIFCVVCGARPYPPPGFREDFDLMKLSSAGRPAEGDEGEWFCSGHFERRGALSYGIVKETDDNEDYRARPTNRRPNKAAALGGRVSG